MKGSMVDRGRCVCEGKGRAPKKLNENNCDETENELMRKIGSIIKRNQDNEQFLTLMLIRARNLEKILNHH